MLWFRHTAHTAAGKDLTAGPVRGKLPAIALGLFLSSTRIEGERNSPHSPSQPFPHDKFGTGFSDCAPARVGDSLDVNQARGVRPDDVLRHVPFTRMRESVFTDSYFSQALNQLINSAKKCLKIPGVETFEATTKLDGVILSLRTHRGHDGKLSLYIHGFGIRECLAFSLHEDQPFCDTTYSPINGLNRRDSVGIALPVLLAFKRPLEILYGRLSALQVSEGSRK